MKRHLVEIVLLAAILISINTVLTQAPRPAAAARTDVTAVFPTLQPSPSEMDELLALSPVEAADLEQDLAFERAAGGELHISRFPAQAAN